MISTYSKDFSWKKKRDPNSPNFEGKKKNNKSQLARFL